jgi:protein Tex
MGGVNWTGRKEAFMDIEKRISAELGLREDQVAGTIALLGEGATVPFIARYRKERTGGLDETQIRAVAHRREYHTELEDRRATILGTIRAQGKMTPALEEKLLRTTSKTELEDLYLPYKPKRVTRASKARDAGLEPLARWLQGLEDSRADVAGKAAGFVDAAKGFPTQEAALRGACDILAEEMADDAEARKRLRDLASREGFFTAAIRKEHAEPKTKYEMYRDYRERVATVSSHRFLAMLRGEREKILRVGLEFPRDKALAYLTGRFVPYPISAAAPFLKDMAEDGLDRLLGPATETEIRKAARDKAEDEAIRVFGENLRDLLLAPPAGQKAVLGIDPGFRTGCKVVAIDREGGLLEYRAIFPHAPLQKTDEAAEALREMIKRHRAELIAVGNGTAGRETESFVRRTLADLPAAERPLCVVVNESGASVYSASELAGREFPDFDVTVRGAVSIARRLQDPLSELVKIDPRSIGVGQYQHDIDEARLSAALEEIVESAVNLVGVNVNLASEEILRRVSGLSRRVAAAIVEYRGENGPFRSRAEFRKVPGLGDKTFEQAAGFLRIPGAKDPLDDSAVHPERYALVEKMAAAIGASVALLVGNARLIRSLEKERFVGPDAGLPTIEDILGELEKPGRDPRSAFRTATFAESVREIADLKPGMALEGVVTNVTDFGAFVDIGVHQDGLIHVSELADRYVTDPRKVVRIGQVVRVRVLKIDADLKRIALSMKNG